MATYAYDPNKLDLLASVTQGGTTSYSYTADGQVSARGSDTLNWDGRGRHSGGTFGGTTVTYAFDAAGFRRLRTGGAVTTHYRLGGLYETNTSGTILNTDAAGLAGDVARYAGPPTTGSTVSLLYYNGHGDVAAEANTSGTRTAAYTYDPFGALRSGSTPANATSERWTGRHDKKLDSSSGLIEMGARPYDPSIGRFLSVDPIEGGSLNGCDFAGQDPVNNADLSGLKSTVLTLADGDEWGLCAFSLTIDVEFEIYDGSVGIRVRVGDLPDAIVRIKALVKVRGGNMRIGYYFDTAAGRYSDWYGWLSSIGENKIAKTTQRRKRGHVDNFQAWARVTTFVTGVFIAGFEKKCVYESESWF